MAVGEDNMKKFISILILIIMIAMIVSGCGNMNFGLGNYNFKKVHILTKNGDGFCVDVESWHDNDTGIEIHTPYYGSMFLSEGTYIMLEHDCPICSRSKGR